MRTFIILLGLLSGAVLPGAGYAASDTKALELLRRIDDLWRGESSHAVMSMRVKTANYERSLRMESWSKGTDHTLVRILSPAREKGTATLKAGEAIYTYLPRTDRTIKLNAGMMGGSWMGSHFTNDDLVREDRLSEDFDVTITFEGVRDGRKSIELTLDPKADAAVVWGRIVTLIDAESLHPLRSDYYDEDLKPSRSMTFSDIKALGGRQVPSRMRLTPADKPGEFTEMSYESLQLDPQVPASLFSLQGLKRR
jgi:outer membrane lipoprotein-sorting protein